MPTSYEGPPRNFARFSRTTAKGQPRLRSRSRILPAHFQTSPNISRCNRSHHAKVNGAVFFLGLAARYITVARKMFCAFDKLIAAHVVIPLIFKPDGSMGVSLREARPPSIIGFEDQGNHNVRGKLNVVERQNILRATVKYLAAKPRKKTAPFTSAWCERLHREMFGDVWKWAGKIRDRDLNLGCPFAVVRENLANLLADLHSWSAFDMPLVEQATRLHYRAVAIHPFENGNGRWSRMLANIWLKRNDHPIIRWPEETIGTESPIRSEYLSAIKLADKGDLEPLIAMHRRYLDECKTQE